jgi:UDP:flavonoid glycosyltransferase YjiC (YdhE family)
VLQKIGAGILLRKHASARHIRAAISAALGDPTYRDAAARLGAGIRQRNGADTAADAITEFTKTYVTH